MKSREIDDYQLDIQFGEWLRSQRVKAGLSLQEAAKAASLTTDRLNVLEVGYCDKGITKAESSRLSVAYRVPLEEFLVRATG